MKFKVGDRVHAHGMAVTGTIINIDEDDDEFPYEVTFIGIHHDITDIFHEDNLKLAEDAL